MLKGYIVRKKLKTPDLESEVVVFNKFDSQTLIKTVLPFGTIALKAGDL